MTNSNQDQLLELYKLHAELADRVSQRRDSANRLFAGLLTGLVVFISALLRFGGGKIPEFAILLVIGLIGIALSIAWFIIIQSYKQLNSNKFRVLLDMETKLSYAFFTDEWDPEAEGRKTNRYWKLTNMERILPAIFAVLFLGVAIYAFFVGS